MVGKNWFKLFFALMLTIMAMPMTVSAVDWQGSTDGQNTTMGTCNSPPCYNGGGLRFSLYVLSNNSATKQGYSYDVWTTNMPNPSYSSYQGTSVRYTDPRTSDSVTRKRANAINGTLKYIKAESFSLTRDQYVNLGQLTLSDYADYRDTNSDFKNKDLPDLIKSEFGTVDDIKEKFNITQLTKDASKYYLVIETLYQINTYTSYTYGWKQNYSYVGTAFELANIYAFEQYTTTIAVTNKVDTTAVKDFVAARNSYLKFANTIGDHIVNPTKSDVIKDKMYGMTVYRLSDIIESFCDCSTAANKYLCAMNYCDANATEDERKKCVTQTCKVEDPGFTSCAEETTEKGSTTICTSSTTSSKTTCNKGTASTYYKTVCTERSNIYYNDSLPTSLLPGSGFSYSVLLSGNKTCNASFETAKWNFDYATSTNANRILLTSKLNSYKGLNKNGLETLKYNSSDAKVKISIEESVKNKPVTNKEINLEHFTNVTATDLTISNTSSTFKVMTDTATSQNKKIESRMSSIYSLPNVCINGASGEIYDAKYDEISKTYKCNKENDGPYKKFFTNLKADNKENKTEVLVTKESSGMNNLKNKCSYTVADKPLTCIVKPEGGTKYTIKAISDYNIDYGKLEYVLSTDPNSQTWNSGTNTKNTLGTITTANNTQTVYGKVRYVGTESVIASCSFNRGEADYGETTCKQLFRRQEHIDYGKIMNYCQENWHTDSGKYMSEKACYESCSQYKACKEKYTCDDKEEKERFCRDRYNHLMQNISYRECINDCACNDGEATYRPISLTNPFPGREAGSNWQGYEETIKQLETNHQPEYVIELSAKDIEDINAKTEQYNSNNEKNAYTDYVWATESDENGKYISKFIHETNRNLFCIINGEGTCN